MRFKSGDLRELFSQTIKAQHVRLHFAELHGEIIDVFLNLLLTLLGLSMLIRQQNATNQRMIARHSVFQRQVIGERRGQCERDETAKDQTNDMRHTDVKRLLCPKVTRNNDNLHVKFLKPSGVNKTLYPRPQGLAQYLDRMPALGAALMHAREGSRQFDVLIEAVPQRLKRFVVSVTASGSTLSLTVSSAEAAHLARLLSSETLANLDRKGLKFNELSVRTQSSATAKRQLRPLPDAASQRDMSTTADRLHSERMQTSLRRLAKTMSGR